MSTPITNSNRSFSSGDTNAGEPGFGAAAAILKQRWRIVLLTPTVAAAAALGITFIVKPTFTAATTFLPPQQQNSATSALASLGSLAGLAAGAAGIKSPADQYVALLQSVNVTDRIIDQFKLLQLYDVELRSQARQELASNVRINLGKKDGLITVTVDDSDPSRSAAMANAYVEQLRRLTSELSITEAQQRRAFFERQLKTTQLALIAAQRKLQDSGFTSGSLNAEPKAAAETFAKLKAEKTAAEVRLQTLRSSLHDSTAEVRSAQAALAAITAQLSALSSGTNDGAQRESGYITSYREFKYQEALFESFSRQLELAKLDEAREGALIQVVDVATPPDRRTKPKRAMTAALAFVLSLLATCGFVIASARSRQTNPSA